MKRLLFLIYIFSLPGISQAISGEFGRIDFAKTLLHMGSEFFKENQHNSEDIRHRSLREMSDFAHSSSQTNVISQQFVKRRRKNDTFVPYLI